MKRVSAEDAVKFFDDQENNCTIRYGDMKKQLAEDVIAFTAPLREKITALASDEKYIHKVATEGAAKARESASKTMSEARKAIGFQSF